MKTKQLLSLVYSFAIDFKPFPFCLSGNFEAAETIADADQKMVL